MLSEERRSKSSMTNLFKDSIKKSLIDGYNRHAVYFSSSRNRAWEEVNQTIKLLPKKAKILDLGCGNGRLLLSLPTDCEYYGIDFSEGLIEEARKLHPGKKFELIDMTSDEFWTHIDEYDAIFAIASLHHLEGKYHKALLNKCFESLKPGGYFVATVWNLLQLRMWGYHINSLWGKLTNGFRSVWVSFQGDFSRYHFTFDKRYLTKIAMSAGFEIVYCQYVSKGKNERWFSGENLVLVAQKNPRHLGTGN